jgi:hypothetical protein
MNESIALGDSILMEESKTSRNLNDPASMFDPKYIET